MSYLKSLAGYISNIPSLLTPTKAVTKSAIKKTDSLVTVGTQVIPSLWASKTAKNISKLGGTAGLTGLGLGASALSVGSGAVWLYDWYKDVSSADENIRNREKEVDLLNKEADVYKKLFDIGMLDPQDKETLKLLLPGGNSDDIESSGSNWWVLPVIGVAGLGAYYFLSKKKKKR